MAVKDGARDSGVPPESPPKPSSGLSRWLAGVRATRAGRLALRIVVGVIGLAMIVGGLILVPLPGPGWLIVFGGLAVLATEFAWANRALVFARTMLAIWTQWLLRQGWPVRILVSLITLACATVIVWLSFKLTFGIDLVTQVRQFARI